MAHNLARPQGLVFHAIEQGLVVTGPDQIARSARDRFAHKLTRLQILYINRVDASADRIHRIGQQPIVFAQAHLPDVEEGMAFGQDIAIENDLFRSLQTMLFPTIDGVLLPFLVARIMVIVADLDGYRVVILFDAARNLLKQLLLKWFGML